MPEPDLLSATPSGSAWEALVAPEGPAEVTLHVDPICPWTWVTATWLVDVAAARHLRVHWRAFSLERLRPDAEVPAEWRDARAFSREALRVLAWLGSSHRERDAAQWYRTVGESLFLRGEPAHPDHLRELLARGDLADADRTTLEEVARDPAFDTAVADAHDRAWALAGPDIGSPVLVLEASGRAVHGPILARRPPLAEGLAIFDALCVLGTSPSFHELKRGRTGPPSLLA